MVQRINDSDIHGSGICFTDEACFFLDSFINKQNWHIWGTKNPHVAIPMSLYLQKVMIQVAISSKGLIGPFFRSKAITAPHYLDILREFVAVQNALENTANTSWFMQDGAWPHRTADVFNFLNEHFDDYVIGLGYPTDTGSSMDLPPYLPDMKPCDFILQETLERPCVPPQSRNNWSSTSLLYVKPSRLRHLHRFLVISF